MKSNKKENIKNSEIATIEPELNKRIPPINQMATGSKRPSMINLEDKKNLNHIFPIKKKITEQITQRNDNKFNGIIEKDQDLLIKQVQEPSVTVPITVTTNGTTHTIIVTGNDIVITIDGNPVKL